MAIDGKSYSDSRATTTLNETNSTIKSNFKG